jgi:hypothetical protein
VFLIFSLEHVIRNAQENQEELELNETHCPIAYADEANLLEESISVIKRTTEALLDANAEVVQK